MSVTTLVAALLASSAAPTASATTPDPAPVSAESSPQAALPTDAPTAAPQADAAAAQDAAAPSATPSIADAAVVAADPAADADSDIVVTANAHDSPTDPLASVNVAAYNATQAVDEAVIAPVTEAYQQTTPSPIRAGVRNFLVNIHEPVVALNYLLQHKVGKTFETVGRFLINSVLGVAGLFDVARREPFNLPHRVNGLGNTLGFYGIGPGPYLFLPLVGPTSLRDAIGGTVDALIIPAVAGSPFNQPYYALPSGALHQLEERIAGDARIRRIRDTTADPYLAQREEFLAQRRVDINLLRCGREDCSTPAVAPASAVLAPPPVTPSSAPNSASAPAPGVETPPQPQLDGPAAAPPIEGSAPQPQ